LKFKVKDNNQTLIFTSEQLFTQILKQAFLDKEQNQTQNIESHVESIEQILRSLNQEYLDVSFKQMFTIYFLAGYYYKIFLTKNDIKIVEQTKD
jgi:hypothetical protein